MFSGIAGRDSSFGRWKHEVVCLLSEHPENLVLSSMRRSLRSPAADILTHLDQRATVDMIMRKLEAIYGVVCAGQTLLKKFYSEHQSTSEKVAEWGLRIEDLAYQAVEKKMLARTEVPTMVKTQFWSGLRDPRLKDALRQRYQQLDVDDLIVEARGLEEEYSSECSAVQQATAQQHQNKPTEMELLMQLLKKMDARLDKLEGKMEPSKTASKKTPAKCTKCHQEGHLYFACRKDTDITCHKCGKVGHLARGCRPLNED